MQASDGNSASAGILADFLPVYDKLLELEKAYGEDDFGKKYTPLPAAMKSAFGEMGVVEFLAAAGDAVDLRKMKVVETEASADVAANKVLRSVAAGLELDGNMVRKAQCVASSGPAAAAEEEAAAEEAVAEDDEAAKE
jgi:molecular chaperone GrpE (heat shock protein)